MIKCFEGLKGSLIKDCIGLISRFFQWKCYETNATN